MRPLVAALAFFLASLPCFAQNERDKQRCPKPKRFAIVFSFGYAGDLMPKDDAKFAQLLSEIKKTGFNTIHCTYTEARVELCKKHDLQMMVDLLADEHHVYKSPEKAKAVCEKLKGNDAVWGYNIWNDPIRKTSAGRMRDIDNVRQWDPTHPAFCGTYRTDGMRSITNPDAFGYYDFHWKRGLDQHLPHLLTYLGWAKERNAWFYSWLGVDAGMPGKGNFNRVLWSANTSIAFGQKGIMWFLAADMMDRNTLAWTETGKDVAKANREIEPLEKVLCEIGMPSAVYATKATKSPNNQPLPEAKAPAGMEKHLFPSDYWLQPQRGELIAGIYEESGKAPVVFVANHNAYEEQIVSLQCGKFSKASRFDRQGSQWAPIAVSKQSIEFRLAPAAAELLRFEP